LKSPTIEAHAHILFTSFPIYTGNALDGQIIAVQTLVSIKNILNIE